MQPDGDHLLLCAVRGREHAVAAGIGHEHHDTMIAELLAAGAVWPESYEL